MNRITEINHYLSISFNQEEIPNMYSLYFYKDYVFVFGECCGVVTYKENDRFRYIHLAEDDGLYSIVNSPYWKNTYWINSEIACLAVLNEYISRFD